MKAKRWTPVVAVAIAASMAFGPTAAADDLVQFETTSTGTRVLTAAVAPTFNPLGYDLNTSQTIQTTAPATALVTEVLAAGSNPWSVKAQMCAPDDYANPVAGNCTTGANQMVSEDDVLDGNDILVTHAAPVKVLGGGTLTAGSEPDLGSQITLLNNTGQNPLVAYSGTYSSSTSLRVENFTRIGVWKGMWVVTATL